MVILLLRSFFHKPTTLASNCALSLVVRTDCATLVQADETRIPDESCVTELLFPFAEDARFHNHKDLRECEVHLPSTIASKSVSCADYLSSEWDVLNFSVPISHIVSEGHTVLDGISLVLMESFPLSTKNSHDFIEIEKAAVTLGRLALWIDETGGAKEGISSPSYETTGFSKSLVRHNSLRKPVLNLSLLNFVAPNFQNLSHINFIPGIRYYEVWILTLEDLNDFVFSCDEHILLADLVVKIGDKEHTFHYAGRAYHTYFSLASCMYPSIRNKLDNCNQVMSLLIPFSYNDIEQTPWYFAQV